MLQNDDRIHPLGKLSSLFLYQYQSHMTHNLVTKHADKTSAVDYIQACYIGLRLKESWDDVLELFCHGIGYRLFYRNIGSSQIIFSYFIADHTMQPSGNR